VLWFDPSSREQLSDGAFRSANPHSIARTIRGKTVFQGVYYPTGKSSRDGPGVVMKAAAQYPGRVHVVVDEFRLMVGRGRRTLPGFDEVVRTHRNSNLSIDFITHRLADTHPDAGVIVQRVIIFGASWPADRKKIKDDYGRDVLAKVDQLEQYQYVWICTRSGLTGVGGGDQWGKFV